MLPSWVEILGFGFLIGFIVLFVGGCAYESHLQSKRWKLWEEMLKLIERYNHNKTGELKKQIKIIWEEYKDIWDKFGFKEITREKVEKMEKFLNTEKII